ncbi:MULTISPECIES: ACP S-malonyltransferase [Sandaracinus]|uniref:ACP S-malonyltransferase n=1 Tax=Sandaracinus TaxID=1055688 RepID=UPI0019D494EF|nr:MULTISPECIES: ACP S-malonyltransferase [Sandaracinus]QRN75751.1 Acyltransferase/malonyl CoA-acyl carrier protein transacylase [Sandaracinus sp.]UJR87251.1 Malonyl CoA-acyl carrier protein transacylase [Sandaracinus amylolyticus]
MKAVVFAGQGSQRRGMGAALFEELPYLTARAEEVLGWSVRELCVSGSDHDLARTEYTQPALYVVQALAWLSRLERGSELPRFAAGHSLGEYAALFAAGVFDFETGLALVKRRGELMGRAAGGAMAAVVGLPVEEVERVLASSHELGIEIANLNSPRQVVLAGTPDALERARAPFEHAGAQWVRLAVGAAFHSSHMESAAREFAAALHAITMRPPRFPVLSNLTARPHEHDPRPALAAQIRATVRWTECVEHLVAQGVTEFEELGEGKVLTGLLRQIRRGQPS